MDDLKMHKKSILIGLAIVILVAIAIWFFFFRGVAQADEVSTLPTDEREFHELLCRMAVGNIQGGVQERRNLFLELYTDQEGQANTHKSYGLLTGFYYGDRGVSHFGQDLDGDYPRYLKNGMQMTNAAAGRLRATTAAFRQSACEPPPEVTPQ